MRIIFLNRLFYPDQSATSQLLSDLASHLAAQGFDVHVIASRQLYDGMRVRLLAYDIHSGVKIHRVWTSRFGRNAIISRIVDSIVFYVSSCISLLGVVRRGDIVIAKTDPPMLSVVTSMLGHVVGFKSVNWLHDIYPEIAMELGVGTKTGLLGRSLISVRNNSLRRAVANVVISEDMADRVRNFADVQLSLRVIPNWSDDDSIVPSDGKLNSLRKLWSLEGQFIVGYSGNLGRAHEFETLLGAAERLKERTKISFLFIGGGYYFSRAEAAARARGLRNIVFKPPQAREFLSVSLTAANIHWISLRPELVGLIFPSKFYGIAAAGRPMIAITALEGELANLIRQHRCGVVISPGDSETLARAILDLCEAPETCIEMGNNARKMLDEKYTRTQAFRRWSDLIDEIVERSSRASSRVASVELIDD